MKITYILISLLSILLSACGPKRNLVYFNDLNDSTVLQSPVLKIEAPKIQPGDILAIQVSSLNPESNILFNSGVLQQVSPSSDLVTNGVSTGPNTHSSQGAGGYQVDSRGDISYPVIGKIHLAGLSKDEAQQKMLQVLNQYVKEPIVNIRYLNFRITVIGEVNRPSTYTIDKDRINVLEALGMAGDMTPYGRRENVLVIREQQGKRDMVRLNMQDSKVFDSPYFYLQQNDIVYVEPSKVKDPTGDRTLRIITAAASIISVATLLIWRLF